MSKVELPVHSLSNQVTCRAQRRDFHHWLALEVAERLILRHEWAQLQLNYPLPFPLLPSSFQLVELHWTVPIRLGELLEQMKMHRPTFRPILPSFSLVAVLVEIPPHIMVSPSLESPLTTASSQYQTMTWTWKSIEFA